MRTIKTWLLTTGPVGLTAIALLVLAYWLIDPTPPSKIVMATGAENSNFEALGQRYQRVLRRHQIKLELRQTNGSRANADLLLDEHSGVDAAFITGGTFSEQERADADLTSLGALFYEPIWLFYREGVMLDALTQLAGMRVNIGAEGSATPSLARNLLAQNGIDPATVKLSQSDSTPAVVELLEGRIDAMMLVNGSEGHLIQMLLRTPGIKLFDFVHAEAYGRRVAALTPVSLPRGVVDLARDMPARDIRLVAPTGTIVLRDGTHPAIAELLVQAASQIHGRSDWFARPGQFPQAQPIEFELDKEAQRFYRHGAPLLQRYLPFWAANLIDRMWVVLLSMAALLIPLTRIIPPLYEWRVRSRIFRWYGELKAIEKQVGELASSDGSDERRGLTERLSELDSRVTGLNVPLSYADEVYFLRQHIDLVRAKLR